MRNVSFDNPYLFLLAIPLILLIVIPFIIAIRKENRQKSTVISFVIHLVIVTLVTFAAAGTIITEYKTQATVYVVADVSYSSDKNLDQIDKYIEEIKKDLPKNTKLGVICFGKAPEVLYMPGEESKSVKESGVDNSVTDISSALLFASNDELYPKESLKRVVLITDAKDTAGGTQGSLVSSAQVLEKKGIKLDAIFLDNNLKDDTLELQLSDLQGTKKTFTTVESELRLMLQANYESSTLDGKTKIAVYQKLHTQDDSKYVAISVDKEFNDVEFLAGFNIKTIKLPKRAEGVYDYKVVLTPSEGGDYNAENNVYTFTQEVSNDINMLVLAGSRDELVSLTEVYGEIAKIDPYVVDVDKKGESRIRKLLTDGTLQNETTVPYTIETLSKYDEIVISNVDVRNIPNTTSFLHYLETVVELFGKNLTTMGNLEIQNKTNSFLKDLEGMLPVTYGNANADKKLYTFVLDASHSVNQAYKFRAIKEIAKSLLTLLNDEDYVAIVSFAGEVKVKLEPTALGPNKEKIIEAIDGLELRQGTMLGSALNTAYDLIDEFDAGQSQVMLISDGKATPYDEHNPKDVAINMKGLNVPVSTINVATYEEDAIELLENLASITGGTYDMLEDTEHVEEFVFSEVADDLTDAIVEKESSVHVKIPDPILDGIQIEPPPIYGYVQTSINPDATVYLTVDYERESDGFVARVPLYSVRNHGNGKVATFASSLAGDWLKGWDDSFKKTFFENMVNSNLPSEKIDYPYTVSIEKGESTAKITVSPADIRQDARATVYYKLAGAEGERVKREMSFDSQNYVCYIDISEKGIYDVQIIYEYEESPGYLIDIHGENSSDIVANLLMENGEVVATSVGGKEYPLQRVHSRNNIGISGKYKGLNENGEEIFEIEIDIKESNITFIYSNGEAEESIDTWSYTMHKGNIASTFVEVPYLAEYNSYTIFTPSVLHASVNGQVVNGGGLKIEIDEDEVEIYEKPLAIYLLVIAMVLFIADVAIRVIRVKKKKGANR